MSVAQSEGSALLRMLGSPSQSRLVAGAGAAGGETLDFADPGLIHPFERLTVKSPQSRPAVVPHILVTGPQTAQALAPPLSPSASPNPSPKRTHHGGRKAQAITNCPHKDRKHYAKGMCNNCYHAYGRKSKATLCPHFDRLNYAKGKCQLCYLNHYHREQRLKKKLKRKEEQDRLGDELKSRGGVGDGATDSTSFAWSPGQSPASSPAASPRSLSAFGSPNRSPSASPRSPRHAHHSLHHVRQVSASPQYCRSGSGQHLQPPSGSLFDWTSTGSPSSPSSAGSSPSLPPSPYRTAAPHPVMAGDLQPVYSPQVYGPGVYGAAEGLCAPADMFVPPPDFHGTMPGSPLGQRNVPVGDQGPVVAGCSPEQHRRARAIVRGMMAADDSVQRFQRQQHEQEQFLQQQELQQQQQQLQLQQQNQQQQQYHQQAATGQPSASLDPCADVFAFVAAPELPAELAGMNLSCAFCGAIAGTCCHQPAPQQHGGEVAPAPWETGLDMELQHAAAFEQNFGLGDMTEYESSLAGLLRDRCATDVGGGAGDSGGVHGPGMMTMEVTAPVPDGGPEGWLVRQLMLRSDSDDRMTQQLQSQPSAGWWQQLDGACGDLSLEG